jgi:hypothetical protein
MKKDTYKDTKPSVPAPAERGTPVLPTSAPGIPGARSTVTGMAERKKRTGDMPFEAPFG